MDIKLPRLGEGAESGTVVSIFVKPGDQVKEGQTILELENEKAVAPIPASASGRVTKLYVKEGDKISAGQPILTLADDGAATPAAAPASAPTAPRVETRPSPAPVSKSQRPLAAGPSVAVLGQPVTNGAVAASPTVRKLARDLGIDLSYVRGSERGGRITVEDLRAHVQQLQQMAAAPSPPAPASKPPTEKID